MLNVYCKYVNRQTKYLTKFSHILFKHKKYWKIKEIHCYPDPYKKSNIHIIIH